MKTELHFGVQLCEFQEAMYVKVLKGENVFVCAQTGCRKTYCFAFMTALLSEFWSLSSLMREQGQPERYADGDRIWLRTSK